MRNWFCKSLGVPINPLTTFGVNRGPAVRRGSLALRHCACTHEFLSRVGSQFGFVWYGKIVV